MKINSLLNLEQRIYAHARTRSYIYKHEGRKFALVVAVLFSFGVAVLWGIAYLAS